MRVRRRLAALAGLVLLGCLAAVSAGALAANRPTGEPAVANATGLAAWPTPASHHRPIRVYFSRHPESDDDFTAVFPVERVATDQGVGAAALRALIAGPTEREAEAGYFSELGAMLSGSSSCGGEDFALRIENRTATLRFCRVVSSAGIGQDARVQSAIEATLRQFSTVQRVRVLGPEGGCLFDMSGEDRCLREP